MAMSLSLGRAFGLAESSEARAASRRRSRNTLISACSNLSTAYNLVNINLAHVIMENEYCGGDNCKSQVTAAGTACLVGSILGQLAFGYIGDCIGRSRALSLTMALSILGALVSAFAVPVGDAESSVFTFLSLSRLVLGVGVGGVYPLAATIAAESSDAANRGRSTALVFSMQGVGTLLVPLVGMVFLYSFGTYEHRKTEDLPMPDISWRLMLGVGALPGILLIPFKTVPPDSQNRLHIVQSPESFNSQITVTRVLRNRRYWPKIIGCAGGWFLFDITFYGNTLFAPTVLKNVFHTSGGLTPVIGDGLPNNLCLQLTILALIGLPGYYVSVYFMDSMGRKNIQMQGFVVMAVLYASLGVFVDDLKNSAGLLLTLYGLTYFSSNFGPNSTTFILPSETFPREVRTSLNGFCATRQAGCRSGLLVLQAAVGLVRQLRGFLHVCGVRRRRLLRDALLRGRSARPRNGRGGDPRRRPRRGPRGRRGRRDLRAGGGRSPPGRRPPPLRALPSPSTPLWAPPMHAAMHVFGAHAASHSGARSPEAMASPARSQLRLGGCPQRCSFVGSPALSLGRRVALRPSRARRWLLPAAAF
ncbi:unnamed protein product [Prorocentrum cordatum]|uniref:Major facilitator superfamily (MFS) profile domain-containing protein n=1 Tax=Prorocentrum cordatum TaxID=2364126 RepID=A0ABN9RZ90_9DINO|nr:unnamed protein product [Polarella glacialis]